MSSETRVGNYIVGELIGRGGMGVVHRGRHATLPREVAIKSIDARTSRDLRRMRHRFEREAFVQSQLDDPSIVKIYDYVVGPHAYHIVMEYVEGSSLAGLLASREGRQLPAERALDLFEQILESVAYAHNFVYRDEGGTEHCGIIHRDLKPANILVTQSDRIKITDFGIVKLVGAEHSADTSGLAYGSPHYVSPEQAEGASVDQRSDIYSLGVIFYEMLTGSLPFDGEGGKRRTRTDILRAHVEEQPRAPSELNPSVTPEVETAVLRALEKKPERRFPSAVEFLRAVRRARGHDTSDLDEKLLPRQARRREQPDTGRLAGVTAEVVRDSYTTQPIGELTCEACGAEVSDTDARCRACDFDLLASPSTKGLTLRETRGRRSARGTWVVFAILALGVLTAALIFFGQRARTQKGDERPATETQPVATTATASSPPTPAESTILSPSVVEVDSSYDGYDAKPLTDGVTDVRQIARLRYNRGNWVSAETPEPHWVSFRYENPVRVTTVYVYWGFDRDRFMPSRRVELQTWRPGEEWVKVAELEPRGDFDRTAFEFEPDVTHGLRIFQPAQQGPASRPFVMWVREVQVYGSAESETRP